LYRPTITLTWIRKGQDSWMAHHLTSRTLPIRRDRRTTQIERISVQNDDLGPQKIWQPYLQLEDYHGRSPQRMPSQVRSSPTMCSFFSHLVRVRKPEVVVEFGTAFGVSGMYWLSALEDNHRGRLIGFEPNEGWAAVAEKNLAAVGSRFTLVRGTFEESIDAALKEGEKIDIALIDAIHTDTFVLPQFEMVVGRLAHGGLVLLDDIHFKGMNGCFERIAIDPRVASSAILCDHVGIVEVRSQP